MITNLPAICWYIRNMYVPKVIVVRLMKTSGTVVPVMLKSFTAVVLVSIMLKE